MRKAAFALLCVLCFMLEARLEFRGIGPNLTVLPVFFVGIRYGMNKGLAFGVLIGFLADSISGGLMGPNILGKGTAALLASAAAGGLVRWTPMGGVIWMLAATAADGVLSHLMLTLFAGGGAGPFLVAGAVAAQGAVNAAAGYFMRPRDED